MYVYFSDRRYFRRFSEPANHNLGLRCCAKFFLFARNLNFLGSICRERSMYVASVGVVLSDLISCWCSATFLSLLQLVAYPGGRTSPVCFSTWSQLEKTTSNLLQIINHHLNFFSITFESYLRPVLSQLS
jgi:hypothetical protein